MKKITIILFSLFFLGACKNDKPNEVKEITQETEIIGYEDHIYDLFLKTANNLYRDSIITIEPEIFANHCMVVGYCESNLNPKCQKGLLQFNQSTLKYCGLDTNISQKSVEEQILVYFPKYLEMCGKNTTQKIKSAVDLHWVIFLPNNKRKCWRYNFPVEVELSDGTTKIVNTIYPLDLNRDSVVDYTDITLFHKKNIPKTLKKYL